MDNGGKEQKADPNRHVKKKRVRDLNKKIRRIQLRMYNRKAKRDVPQLQAKLVALLKAKDEVLRGNLKLPTRTTIPARVCSVCNGKIGRGYHICKPGEWQS